MDFLTAIQTVTERFDADRIKIKGVTIPQGSFTEFDVMLASYPIKFSLDSTISDQLDIFKIFKQKKLDTGEITPQYIDLRFDGRVYFK